MSVWTKVRSYFKTSIFRTEVIRHKLQFNVFTFRIHVILKVIDVRCSFRIMIIIINCVNKKCDRNILRFLNDATIFHLKILFNFITRSN